MHMYGGRFFAGVVFAAMLAAHPDDGFAREQIRIVGSSTVFPFSSSVAERFGRKTPHATPIVEATGTGGGFSLFCAGVGVATPDITNASRPMKQSEYKNCQKNMIDIVQIRIGFDGIVLANSRKGPEFHLTRKQIFQALAKDVPVNGKLVHNPYKRWSDISPDLPDVRIRVLGPPPTSGTRDAFVEQAMEAGALAFPMLQELRKRDKKTFKGVAHGLREDGLFVEAGENDNLIVQKLRVDPEAVGIFGFGFLDNNIRRIKGAIVEGVSPTFENIASGKYSISRSLFFYVKRNHINLVPGIADYIGEFIDENSWGLDGYLTDKGLIPLADADRREEAENARALAPFEMR